MPDQRSRFEPYVDVIVPLGVSAVAALGIALYYLQWLSADLVNEQRAWLWFGALVVGLVLAAMNYLRVRADRTGSPLTYRLFKITGVVVGSIASTGVFVGLSLLHGLALGTFLVWVKPGISPTWAMEPAIFWLAGGIAAVMLLISAVSAAYLHWWKDYELGAALATGGSVGIGPFAFFVAAGALLGFLAFDISLLAIGFGFAEPRWLHESFPYIMLLGAAAMAIAVAVLYRWRRPRVPEWEDKVSTLTLAIQHVLGAFLFVGLGLFGVVMVVAMGKL